MKSRACALRGPSISLGRTIAANHVFRWARRIHFRDDGGNGREPKRDCLVGLEGGERKPIRKGEVEMPRIDCLIRAATARRREISEGGS
jgi:hypothetical protein